MKQLTNTVPTDAYFLIDVVWEDGLKHSIACRGYNLGSWLRFQKSLSGVKSYKYKQITEKQYNKKMGLE